MSLQSDLIEVRRVLATPEKWVKGRYTNGDGCYCILGAGKYVTGKGDGGQEFKNALIAALPQNAPEDARFFPHVFNDADTTTHADILAWLDRAIKAAS
jgi:hypothetical protein